MPIMNKHLMHHVAFGMAAVWHKTSFHSRDMIQQTSSRFTMLLGSQMEASVCASLLFLPALTKCSSLPVESRECMNNDKYSLIIRSWQRRLPAMLYA